MNPVETYLKQLRTFHNSGETSEEISFYPALSTLLNSVGGMLTPHVVFVQNIKDRGAGYPDGGLFTAEQVAGVQKKAVHAPTLLEERKPARGVVEIKGTADDVRKIAKGKQVRRYWTKYQQVLVTNYRDFVLVVRGEDGKPVLAESYTLATTAEEFWGDTVVHTQKAVKTHGDALVSFLRRALTHAAPIVSPQDIAAIFAAYARQAKAGITDKKLPALDTIKKALEQALGLKFEGEKGEAFFRSTLVQTLFYGVFSAWVLWARKQMAGDVAGHFDWRTSAHYLRVPILRKLFHEVADPGHLEELGLAETLDWAEAALGRVVLGEFFEQFKEEAAIQYFYEPFLVEFDPELRKEMGVWYTPHEIVRYQVARVDAALRDELGLTDGLADPNVYVLDPCCGTGAYLVEVLDLIAKRLADKGGEALVGAGLKKAAKERIFGFEIMPAPYVVSHLQLGLLLQRHGAPLSEVKSERVGVFLTNALTGWEPPEGVKEQLAFSELSDERDAAEKVKRETPILVILGNPPYNGFAGVSPAEELGLIDAYKAGLKDWGITKNYLDDLYIRFWRLAERRIVEKTGSGIVCYISNFSYMTDPSSVVMRQRLLGGFDTLWFDSLNGDSRETGKKTASGDPDPSVFSTAHNKEGIRVGTAVALLVRKTERQPTPTVRYREFWGAAKREALVASLDVADLNADYEIIHPAAHSRFALRPIDVAAGYREWPSVLSLSAVKPSLGLNDNRAQATHDMERAVIESRMRSYYDATVTMDEVRDLHSGLATNASGFDASKTRLRLLAESGFVNGKIVPFWFRPFDLRWAYVERLGNLWNRTRPELLDQSWSGNEFLLVRARAPKLLDGTACYYTRAIGDQHVLHKDAYFIPFRLRLTPKPAKVPKTKKGKKKAGSPDDQELSLGLPAEPVVESSPAVEVESANLSEQAREYLAALGMPDPDAHPAHGALIWQHCLAIGYTPAYLEQNADGIRHDWPRFPLPATAADLRASAELGRQVRALLDTSCPVSGVTTGKVRPFLSQAAVVSRQGGGSLDPDAGHFDLTVGWGHNSNGVTMPGQGRAVLRDYTSAERTAMGAEAQQLGLSDDEVRSLLGEQTYDIFLNDVALWRNVPACVWQYTIGGFQAAKKWLSYREHDLIERGLSFEEITEFSAMSRRIAALLLLSPKLDASYTTVALNAYSWPSSASVAAPPSEEGDEAAAGDGEE